ncbi:MAG: DciA family protein [Cytophagales bacterium]|nr:DUF721 domain-containing protein [Bernardetiaceae bacterium]MDW8205922.1 DciA family protein [Cytophagales bacterium]
MLNTNTNSWETVRNSEATPLKEVINRMLQAYGLAEKYHQVQVVQSLRNMLAPHLSSQIDTIYIRNNQIVMQVSSAALRQELAMWRDQLLLRLKEKEPLAANIQAIVLI